MNGSSSDEGEKIAKQRGYVVQELIDTEKKYVAQLQLVVDVFIDPLRLERILDDGDIKEQFLNWEPILGLHEQLLEQLEAGSSALGDTKVGQIFIKYSSFFKMYMQYLSNFEIALTRRAELMCKNRKFLNFLEKAEKDSRCRGMGIESFLVTPVQRIPRYRMLLEQILKCTPKQHEDYMNLSSSLSKIIDVATANNEAIRQRDSKDMIMRIMMSLDSKTRVNLLDVPTRIFIMESEMMRQCRRGKKKFKFWLFNDKILYGEENATVVKQCKVYSLNREILLIACRVSEAVGECGDVDRAFLIESPSKSFIVWANSVAEKDEWILNIQRCILSERENWEIETGKVAPLWTPDAQSKYCSLCKAEFSTFFRRHHCRHCGTLVCDNCSNRRVLIPHVSNLPVRSCDNCYEELAEAQTDHRYSHSTESTGDFSHFSLRRQGSSFMESVTRKGSVFGSILGIGNNTSTSESLKIMPKLKRASALPITSEEIDINQRREVDTRTSLEEDDARRHPRREDSMCSSTQGNTSYDRSSSFNPPVPSRPIHLDRENKTGSFPTLAHDVDTPHVGDNELLQMEGTGVYDNSEDVKCTQNLYEEASTNVHDLLCKKYSVMSVSSIENPFRQSAPSSTRRNGH